MADGPAVDIDPLTYRNVELWCERQRKHGEEVTRCRTELEHAEKDAEFGSAINDMLANM